MDPDTIVRVFIYNDFYDKLMEITKKKRVNYSGKNKTNLTRS